MSCPEISARVEQSDCRLCDRVNAREIRTFLAVAFRAAQGKVVAAVVELMLCRNDVINIKRGLVPNLRKPAIFANIAGALDY